MKHFIVRILEFIKIRILKYDPSEHLKKNVKVGRGTYGVEMKNCYLFRDDDAINIGNYCSIAQNVVFLASGEHYIDRVSTYPFHAQILKKGAMIDTKTNGPIEIGNDVWIGFNCTILSGSKVGNGVVIAAHSLVKGNLEPYGIYAGTPAKLIKKRFSDDEIKKLENIAWWNWPSDKISNDLHDFYKTPREFIEKYSKRINI